MEKYKREGGKIHITSVAISNVYVHIIGSVFFKISLNRRYKFGLFQYFFFLPRWIWIVMVLHHQKLLKLKMAIIRNAHKLE